MKAFTYRNLEYNGRCANQIYQIAWLMGQQRRMSDSVACIKPDWTYRPYFSIPDSYYRMVPAGAEIIDGETNYFQELRHFSFMADDIRRCFSPSDDALAVVRASHPEFWRATHRTSVHVRRGDYLQHPTCFVQCTSAYYRAAVSHARANNPDTTFCVFSDDLAWCERNRGFFGFDESDDVIFMHGNGVTPVEVCDRIEAPTDQYDLFYMNNCDAHIISNSTFAIWGAWLPDSQEVYVPDRWFGPELIHLPWRLAIPDHWTYLPC